MDQLDHASVVHCANCGTVMEGEFCHHCGQSVHSVLKPVHHMLEDGLDMFLHVDGRILHTLPPLVTRPGFLTLEYFAGRRQRYVAPFRLMFVLCLLSFFAFHLVADRLLDHAGNPAVAGKRGHQDTPNPFAADATAADVRRHLDRELASLHTAQASTGGIPGVDQGLEVAERRLRGSADKRLVELKGGSAAGAASSSSTGTTPVPNRSQSSADPDEAEWDRVEPVHIAWLPEFANARLTEFTRHLKLNLKTAFHSRDASERQEARERMVAGFFSVLPQSMLVMIPLFALLLKVFYLFRRRLYMEHVIVALHSHAFLFVALLLVLMVGMLSTWLHPVAPWMAYPLGVVRFALIVWMFAYLLVMQKRIYRQGWGMTLVKYWFVGWCYFWLLSTVLGVALVLGAGH
ncbi:DUF3667 domain-containing protein [Dyella lutea]|uniref:DUF3667 domain-containing protein n=1 Tax=Dyella lutea TaxID=2950441 RepID=A0ABT1FI88_9GAMM|nr:DUF3667 domain-containing protein [Dyella lutea]MCP1376138.1 DUF3667 domain-containing protein [Dyella lutea]